MVTENEMLQYFIKENRVLTLDDLSRKYIKYGGLIRANTIANALEAQGKITPVPKQPHAWVLSEETKEQYKINIEKLDKEATRNSKEYEKLELELEDLRNRIFDYPKTRHQSKWSFRIAILSGLISLVTLGQLLICNKPD